MRGNQPVYRSFLLRFWHENDTQEMTLRIIVVDTQTGERYGFNIFEDLIRFLRNEIDRSETRCKSEEETIEEN